jgi:hypothetical protein
VKYGNTKTQVGDLTFDSKAEARRWGDLVLLQRGGHISDLKRQVKVELVAGVKLHGEDRARPPIRLVVDFQYLDHNTMQIVWEDCKGMETPLSRAKRHMAKAIQGIDVRVSP